MNDVLEQGKIQEHVDQVVRETVEFRGTFGTTTLAIRPMTRTHDQDSTCSSSGVKK